MRYITVQELKQKMEKKEPYQLLDTRDRDKFLQGHIPTAVNIPQIDLPESIDLLETEIPLIIYCAYGKRSQAPFLYLKEKKKFKNLYILEGGLFEWANTYDENLPVL